MDGGNRRGAATDRGRLPVSPALVLACLALLAAMGGFAYAGPFSKGGAVPNNSIKSRHIVDGEVKNADLAPNSVGTDEIAGPVYNWGAIGSKQILNGSVVNDHFADGSVGSLDVSDHSLTQDDFDLGEIHPRRAYYDLGDSEIVLQGQFTTVAEVELPKGNYLIFARVMLGAGLDRAAASCIVLPAFTTQSANHSETNPVAFGETILPDLRDEPVAMTGVFTAVKTVDLRLRCSRGQKKAYANYPQLVAMRLEVVK